jgi:hypothetical protein
MGGRRSGHSSVAGHSRIAISRIASTNVTPLQPTEWLLDAVNKALGGGGRESRVNQQLHCPFSHCGGEGRESVDGIKWCKVRDVRVWMGSSGAK